MKKNIENALLIAIPALIIIFNLVYYIQSYSFYQDEWGTDISFDSDYLVYMLCGVALLIPAIIQVMKGYNKESYLISGVVVGSLLGFYPLGIFFKTLFKTMLKDKPFDFVANQGYLYMGIIGCVLFAYVLMLLIDYKRQHRNI